MLQIIQTLFLSLLQGVTELFPISSLGHTVILSGLFHWGNITTDTGCGGKSCFLPLITSLHLGTSFALIIYFWKDWVQVVKTLLNSIRKGEIKQGTDEWVSWLVIIGCIPAGLLGLFLENPLKEIFASPTLAAAFLIVNGSVLYLGEGMRRRADAKMRALAPYAREIAFRPLKSLSWKEALIVGAGQALALIPGISRSGTTMVAALGVRLSYEDSARFSFLMGTPIILAAAALEVPQLFKQHQFPMWEIVLGMVLSGIAAYASTKFLMKYFEKGTLTPFVYYCWGFGTISLILLLTVLR